jgi:L-lactate dehydrogenase complex protein LldF
VKIQIPEMLIQLREQLHDAGEQKSRMESFGYWLWATTTKRPWLYRLLTWFASRTIGRVKRHEPWLSQLPGQLGGWTQKRDCPAPAAERFRDWWKDEGRQ